MKHIFPTVLSVVALFYSVHAIAQPLADRVPADSIFYIGWNGTDTMPAAYEGTNLQAVVENSKIRELFTQFLPALIDKISASGAPGNGARQVSELSKSLIQTILRHPTAFCFAGLDMSNPRSPQPRMMLLCQAGNDAQPIETQLSAVFGRGGAPFRTAVAGDVLVIEMGYPQAGAAVVTGAASLASAPDFTAALKQTPQPQPMFVLYGDYTRLFAMVDTLLQMSPPQSQAMVLKVIDALGIKSVKHVIATAGFDGKDWMTQAFAEIPEPRTGIFEVLNSQPIPPELLKAIPADATFAATGRFSAAKLVAKVRASAGQIDPQAGRMVEQVFGLAQMALGVSAADVLEPLGEDWAAYCAPSVAGNGALGMVMVNKLSDPAKAARTLPIAWTNLNNWANVALSRSQAPVRITGQTIEVDATKINYIGLPIIAPSWTIKDGYLYLGLYPQNLIAAARATQRSDSAKSFASSERFVALQKRLNVSNPVGFSFFDLQTTAAQGSSYETMLALARYAGMGDLFGVPLPEPLVPPLDILQKHLEPAGSMQWVDAAGVHEKAISPFPGSKLLSEPGMFASTGPASIALMTSILLPSLNRARETANRVKCAADMKTIGQAILLYANDNRGAYPPDMGALVLYMDSMHMPRGTFLICPSSGHGFPPGLEVMAPDQYAAWANDHSDYIYMGGGFNMRTATAQTVVLYEKAEDHNNDGMNILFGDGHVDFVRTAQAMNMIQRQMQRGGR